MKVVLVIYILYVDSHILFISHSVESLVKFSSLTYFIANSVHSGRIFFSSHTLCIRILLRGISCTIIYINHCNFTFNIKKMFQNIFWIKSYDTGWVCLKLDKDLVNTQSRLLDYFNDAKLMVFLFSQ